MSRIKVTMLCYPSVDCTITNAENGQVKLIAASVYNQVPLKLLNEEISSEGITKDVLLNMIERYKSVCKLPSTLRHFLKFISSPTMLSSPCLFILLHFSSLLIIKKRQAAIILKLFYVFSSARSRDFSWEDRV